jgi:protein CpxP
MSIGKLTVSLLGLTLCTGLALAQAPVQDQTDNPPAAESTPPSPQRPPDPDRQARRLGRQLGLSADQVSQIEPVIAHRQQQLENVRTDPTLTPRQRRMKVRGIMRRSNGKIESVMSDSQKQQYQQLLQTRREARRQRMQQQQQAQQPQAPQDQAPEQQAPEQQAPQQPQQQ